jgi:multicomponent Na+:H+ antiporter subunit B
VSRRGRLTLFAVAGAALLVVLVIGLRGVPAFGDYHGVYGLRVDRIEPPLRHATDIVTALNFDLRAFDTLGEEFILFASVAGVALLLRQLRDEDEKLDVSRGIDDHTFAGASESLRVLSLVLVPLLVAAGAYLAFHGQLTPGGGFQAGVVLAAGPLAILLAGRYVAVKRLAGRWMEVSLESLEAIGAAAYVLIGLGGLVFASIYFRNYLPLGESGELLSAGMMPLNSVAVGLEVTGAFLLTWTEFLDQALLVEHSAVAGEER